jgi:large subunit ribosomal protein L13
MKIKSTKRSDIIQHWHLFDAKGKAIGRLAGEIALVLRGKNKPYFVPHLDCGDYAVVVNASYVKATGNKETQKVYTRYSGYPGGLKTETLGDLRIRKPGEVIRHAVSGMLPHNKLHKQWLKRLYIYSNETHPYGDKFSK